MGYKGSGNYIGTESTYYINYNSTHYGAWNTSDVGNALKEGKWTGPAASFAATGGIVSTTSYNNEEYRIHTFETSSTSGITTSLTVTSDSDVGLSFELTSRSGGGGGGQNCSGNTPGCSGPAGSASGGGGGGGRVTLVHNYQIGPGTYTVYVGMGTFGTAIRNSDGEEILRVSNANDGNPAGACQPRGGWSGYADPGSGASGPPTSDSYVKNPGEAWYPGVVINTYSGGAGGQGGFTQGGCNSRPNQGGSTGAAPGWANASPNIPNNPLPYQNVMAPSILINNGSAAGTGGNPSGGYNPFTSPTGGEYRVGRLRFSYPTGVQV